MSEHVATIGATGQLMLPADIREALELTPGTRVVISREGDHVLLRPVNHELLKEIRGITAGGASMSDELLKERRQEEQQSKW